MPACNAGSYTIFSKTGSYSKLCYNFIVHTKRKYCYLSFIHIPCSPKMFAQFDNLAPKYSVLSLRNCPRALSSPNITTSRNLCKSYFTSNNLLSRVKEPRTLHRIQLPHACRRVSRTHSHLYKDVLLSFIPALLHAESTRYASSNR
jgi:hypothetical protein